MPKREGGKKTERRFTGSRGDHARYGRFSCENGEIISERALKSVERRERTRSG
jgi:hypothetical protein